MVAISAAIGPAMQALSKVKARSWKAMQGAIQEVKGMADPMNTIRAALSFTAPILKVIGGILKLLGASVTQTTIVAVEDLLKLLTDEDTIAGTKELGTLIGTVVIPVIEALTLVLSALGPGIVAVTDFFNNNAIALGILKFAVAPMANLLLLLSNNFRDLYNGIRAFINPIIEWVNRVLWITGIRIPELPYMYGVGGAGSPETYHGGRQYGGVIPRTGYYRLHKKEVVTPAGKTKTSEIHIHIDLRNAVVDNVERLSQRIAEQVLIQVG